MTTTNYFKIIPPMQWYATHDEEGHKQDLKVKMLNTKVYPIIQPMVFVTHPHVGLKHLIT
jgi:hypothetical protein